MLISASQTNSFAQQVTKHAVHEQEANESVMSDEDDDEDVELAVQRIRGQDELHFALCMLLACEGCKLLC